MKLPLIPPQNIRIELLYPEHPWREPMVAVFCFDTGEEVPKVATVDIEDLTERPVRAKVSYLLNGEYSFNACVKELKHKSGRLEKL